LSHFSASQWFDFARQKIPETEKALMEEHLEEGCEECRSILVMWIEVLEINRGELKRQPPAEAVRFAKALFRPDQRWKWLPQIAELSSLIFDSVWQPAPVAVRGSAPSSRQFLHEAKPFMVDLRVEYESARNWVNLIGQVLNSAEPTSNVADIEVFLLKGEHLTARADANTSGEFALAFKDEEGLQLFVDIRGRKIIEIPLPPLSKDRSKAAGVE
jgi:hypothetical protein